MEGYAKRNDYIHPVVHTSLPITSFSKSSKLKSNSRFSLHPPSKENDKIEEAAPNRIRSLSTPILQKIKNVSMASTSRARSFSSNSITKLQNITDPVINRSRSFSSEAVHRTKIFLNIHTVDSKKYYKEMVEILNTGIKNVNPEDLKKGDWSKRADKNSNNYKTLNDYSNASNAIGTLILKEFMKCTNKLGELDHKQACSLFCKYVDVLMIAKKIMI